MKNLITIIAVLLTGQANGQDLFWSNATVHINDTALIYVNGNIHFEGSTSELTNHGSIAARRDQQDGDFKLSSGAASQAGGAYYLQGDFINDGIFIPDTSHVHLDGNNQLITGSNSTTFFKLEMDSLGVKTLTIDSKVLHQLILHDSELATDSYKMVVMNTDTSAITNDQTPGAEGFVSSLSPGALTWRLNSTNTYHFPLGSNVGTFRYRPVEIRTPASNSVTYSMALVNNSATLDGYDISLHDSTICRINDLYYHRIVLDSGMVQANLRLYFDGVADGLFNEQVRWEDQQANQWGGIGNDIQGSGIYDFIQVNNQSDFDPEYFALALQTPESPSILGDTVICDALADYAYSVQPDIPGSTYNWQLPNGANISTGQGTSNVAINWAGSGGGSLGLIAIDSLGCASFPVYAAIHLEPVNAAFDTLTNNLNATFDFLNQSTDADDYYWTFGDGGTSYDADPNYVYNQTGTYEVVLLAENDWGCLDTANMIIEILPGVVIPNVFTPNGDGLNDVFLVEAIGVQSSDVVIMNRWGQEVYRSDEVNFEWDGRNLKNGKWVPEGTYYFVYRGETQASTIKKNGTISLFRD